MQLVSLEFFVDIILPITLWPWCRLSLWQKWVLGGYPGGKCGLCVRLTTLPPSCAVVMKSGNLNFLEHIGALQACNGPDLPFIICNKSCVRQSGYIQSDTKKKELLKTPTKIEEIKKKYWQKLNHYNLPFKRQ